MNNGVLFLSCMVEMSPGTGPKIAPQQNTHRGRHTHIYDLSPLCYEYIISICLFSREHVCSASCLSVLQQDMGQEVEPYFQEVLASLEQSLEEGVRGEGGVLRSRLLQLYNEILANADSGRISLKSKCRAVPDHISFGQGSSV